MPFGREGDLYHIATEQSEVISHPNVSLDISRLSASENISHPSVSTDISRLSVCENISHPSVSTDISRLSASENISHERNLIVNDKSIKELAVELTVEMTTICDGIKGRAVFTNQLLRSCSSIGANSHEAKYAQSKADFISKMEIALKECYETEYWLEILFKVSAIDEIAYKNAINKCGTIRRKLISSVTTAKSRKE